MGIKKVRQVFIPIGINLTWCEVETGCPIEYIVVEFYVNQKLKITGRNVDPWKSQKFRNPWIEQQNDYSGFML